MSFHPMQWILMAAIHADDPQVRTLLYQSYRAFFDLAEKKRRWSLAERCPLGPVQPRAGARDCQRRRVILRGGDVPARLYRQGSTAASRESRLGLVPRQLGIRGVQALSGFGRLAAPLRPPHGQAARRYRRPGLLPGIEPTDGQRRGHARIRDGAGLAWITTAICANGS